MKKRTFDVTLFCGAIFAGIGLPFFLIGVAFALNMEYLMKHGEGDVWILPVVFSLLGAIFFILGIFLLHGALKRRAAQKKLVKDGHYIMAEIVGVVADWSVRINNRPGCRIVCRYEDPLTGQVYEFSSEAMLSATSNCEVGKRLKVYVDPKDYSNYYIELEKETLA